MIVKTLLEKGANPTNYCSNKNALVDVARRLGHENIIKRLEKYLGINEED